jgi:hypothetical protein
MKRPFRLRAPQCRGVVLALPMLAAALVQLASAQTIQLRPAAQLLYVGGSPPAPGTYAIPCVTDWNGDGRKDLIVGYQSTGKVALFLNAGSDASPAFANFANLQAGGVDIVHTSYGCGAPAPFVCDYDCDGKRDLVVGTGQEGYVYFYRNTNADAAPILAPGTALLVGASALTVGYRATPCIYDWDGDGLKDLLCGNGDGYVFFFKNIGTAQSPAYAASTRIQAAAADLNLGIRSVVRVFDWDGDGVKDLVGSSDTGVYWCRNIGSDSSPSLQAKVALSAPVSGKGLTPINTGGRMRLDLVDWNNDGTIDLLIGNSSGTVSYYEGYRFAFTQMAAQPPGQVVCQWGSAPFLNYHVLAGSSLSSITNQVATSLPSGGMVTRWTNSAAGGQQFYRVSIAQ